MKHRIEALARKAERQFIYLEHTGSTNDIAADPRLKHGDVVIAESQGAGRGQAGNSWSSLANQNLTFTLVAELNIAVSRQFLISQATSLALYHTLKRFIPDADVRIKWPNDIYVDNKKICGILIENRISGTTTNRTIIGIGLNVNQDSFDKSIPNPTSMCLEADKQFDRSEVFEHLYSLLIHMLSMIKQNPEAIEQEYIKQLYRLNQWHTFSDKNGTFKGRITDVKQSGEIVIEGENGELRHYFFKQVEYII